MAISDLDQSEQMALLGRAGHVPVARTRPGRNDTPTYRVNSDGGTSLRSARRAAPDVAVRAGVATGS